MARPAPPIEKMETSSWRSPSAPRRDGPAGRGGRGLRRPGHAPPHVKAYEGEIESLTPAESVGVGVRVIVGPPPGLRQRQARLDEDVIARDAGRSPRQRHVRREPDEWYGLADAQRGGAGRARPVERSGLACSSPTTARSSSRFDLERPRSRRRSPHRGVRSAAYHDGRRRRARWPRAPASAPTWRGSSRAPVGVAALARDEGDESTIAGGGSGQPRGP